MAIETRDRAAQKPQIDVEVEELISSAVRPEHYLGRSVRVVGPQESPDPHDDPHAKNRRGELGKTTQNFYFNRFLKDPLSRMGHNVANNDAKAVLGAVLSRGAKGVVNTEKIGNVDPVAMTKHIKRVAKAMG